MQIKEMKSYTEWRKMYMAWINTGYGWFSGDMLFESMDSIRTHYEGMPEYARTEDPDQADRWENAEIVIVPVEVAIPDEVKEETNGRE